MKPGSTMEARAVARAARLKYVTARARGIRRVRRGQGFAYVGPATVRLPLHQERIRRLAIPPAWREVWICADPRGHLQATGLDARGRLQYRYHADWRLACDALKFRRVVTLGEHLPRIRRRVSRDLKQEGLPRTKVLAAIVRLLERSLIRVGNTEYARENGSFGLTTLRKRHVGVRGGEHITFRFVGKGSIEHDIDLFAPRLAAVIRACQELPGRDLFQYEEPDGTVRDLTAAEVNGYLKAIAPVTAKDFRTWGATVLFHAALMGRPRETSQRGQARQVRAALAEVAEVLGNTVAVCRNSYVHPAVSRRYLAGALRAVRWREPAFGRAGLSGLERATLKLLKGTTR